MESNEDVQRRRCVQGRKAALRVQRIQTEESRRRSGAHTLDGTRNEEISSKRGDLDPIMSSPWKFTAGVSLLEVSVLCAQPTNRVREGGSQVSDVLTWCRMRRLPKKERRKVMYPYWPGRTRRAERHPGSAAFFQRRVKSETKKTTVQHCRSLWVPSAARGPTDAGGVVKREKARKPTLLLIVD